MTPSSQMARYDFIIVGGGSSACVAATRLVRDFGCRVLMLERGPAQIASIMRMPAGYMKYLARDDFLEMHETLPQPRLGGRTPIVPQAKVLGGGSAVNAMVYMRGQREDYDAWEAYLGKGAGWSYSDVLPHFKAMERNAKFNNAYHGIDGELLVSDPGNLCDTTQDFLLAAQEMGHPYNSDFNGERQSGVGIMQHTMGRKDKGRMIRCDAVSAFLSQVRDDSRLTIFTGALVSKVIIEHGRAIGVEYEHQGKTVRAYAEREVLVAAGTYNTVKLLMLSGIGPAEHLKRHGLPVVADLRGVGSNLQDHHEVPIIASTCSPSGYFGQDKGWRMVRNGLQYVLFGTGPVTTTGIESCLFYDPDGTERPTIQLYCAPIVYLDRDVSSVKATYGVTLTSCLLRPKARGSVRLRSANPSDKPLVDANFFGDPDDLRLTLASLREARKLLAAKPLGSKIAQELLPGADMVSDEALADYCSRTIKTNYHPSGSARMGPDGDPMAVLDSRMRVRGISNLRVIDCSAMPFIPSANTNAAALMLGHRAAEFAAAPSHHSVRGRRYEALS